MTSTPTKPWRLRPAPLQVLTLGTLLVAAAGNGQAQAQSQTQTQTQTERGRYLVNTSGCHDCHTPFKLGPSGPQPDMARMLSGHPEGLVMPPAPALPPGPWLTVSAATNTAYAGPWGVSFSANLTPDADTGLGRWTARDFVSTIRNGRHMGKGRPVLPPMPVPVYNHFNDGDLEAIFAYLRTVPALKNRVPEPLPPAPAVARQ